MSTGIHGVSRSLVQRGVMILFALALWAASALAAPVRTVLVMGDSLGAGYGLAAHQGWVDLIAQKLNASHAAWRVVNASISGETTAGGAARIAAALTREHPEVVVLELGANDGLRGLPLQQTRANLEAMVRAAQTANAKVLVIGMRVPPNYGPDYARGFEANFSDVAKKYRTAYLPFLLAPIARDRNAFQEDNLHPIAAVQPKLRDYVWPALQPLLR
jgi:acyl-CoA thioesterase-1